MACDICGSPQASDSDSCASCYGSVVPDEHGLTATESRPGYNRRSRSWADRAYEDIVRRVARAEGVVPARRTNRTQPFDYESDQTRLDSLETGSCRTCLGEVFGGVHVDPLLDDDHVADPAVYPDWAPDRRIG